MKVTENFVLKEFVPERVIEILGEERAYHLMHPNMYSIAQKLRDHLGHEILINHGSLNLRGWRPVDTPVGSRGSYHKLGMAIDISSPGYHPSELLDIIQRDWSGFRFLGVRRVENPKITRTWLHIDMAKVKGGYLKVFNP